MWLFISQTERPQQQQQLQQQQLHQGKDLYARENSQLDQLAKRYGWMYIYFFEVEGGGQQGIDTAYFQMLKRQFSYFLIPHIKNV